MYMRFTRSYQLLISYFVVIMSLAKPIVHPYNALKSHRYLIQKATYKKAPATITIVIARETAIDTRSNNMAMAHSTNYPQLLLPDDVRCISSQSCGHRIFYLQCFTSGRVGRNGLRAWQ